MECFICSEEAERLPAGGDWAALNCPDCGRYRVTGTLVAIMRAGNEKLDREPTLQWLARRREFDDFPLIGEFDAFVVRK
ncbi:hypothetical protein VV867_09120 [Pseudomonas sp. JH-2]|uniref:hypothetical protein n=1 Tax=Pseudomonas sp. JH-2 TaxID=3114998 RepID=UPI002E256F2C|nr:hypothetical protein [Pseudomonas sp. JH-2]